MISDTMDIDSTSDSENSEVFVNPDATDASPSNASMKCHLYLGHGRYL